MMNYTISLLTAALLTFSINAMEERRKLTFEEAQDIANHVNYIRNCANDLWLEGTTDPWHPFTPSPYSIGQTTARHILLLEENGKTAIIATRNPKLIDHNVRKLQQHSLNQSV